MLVTPSVAGPEAPEPAQRGYVLNVYTVPDFRNRGLAHQLAKKAIECWRQHGFTILWLHASDRGRPLYELLGFQTPNEMRFKNK